MVPVVHRHGNNPAITAGNQLSYASLFRITLASDAAAGKTDAAQVWQGRTTPTAKHNTDAVPLQDALENLKQQASAHDQQHHRSTGGCGTGHQGRAAFGLFPARSALEFLLQTAVGRNLDRLTPLPDLPNHAEVGMTNGPGRG